MKHFKKSLDYFYKISKHDIKLIDTKIIKISSLTLILIFVSAFVLRLNFQDWDSGFYLHPDERFIVSVTTKLQVSPSLDNYLDPQSSTMSPYNNGYNSFVYGTFPLTLTKIIANVLSLDSYDKIGKVGRTLSALFDMGTLLIVFLIAKKIFEKKVAILAAFFYAFNVLAIQQSHFYTVDNFATFAMLLCFYFILKTLYELNANKIYIFLIIAGIAFGMGISSKASALILLSVIFSMLGLKFLVEANKKRFLFNIVKYLSYVLILTFFTYLSIRVFDPYILIDANFINFHLSPIFSQAVDYQSSLATGKILVPFTYQWMVSNKLISPLINLLIWGFGGTVGAIGLLAFIYRFLLSKNLFKDIKQRNYKNISIFIILIWILVVFLYNALNFMRYLRYFLPIVPFILILASYLIVEIKIIHKNIAIVLLSLTIITTLFWTLAFISIYKVPNTRVSASQWIYSYVPRGSIISVEAWDDSLPLSLNPSQSIANLNYTLIQLDVYDSDNDIKLMKLYENLEKSDFLAISSARASASIGKLPLIYPYMSKYYDKVDSGSFGFKLVKDFRVHPNFLGIDINDESSEESFTIYDHPVVKIYEKISSLTFDQFKQILIQ